MSNSVNQAQALLDAQKLREEGRRRVDSDNGLVWATTKVRSWSEWNVYVEGHPRPRRVGMFLSSNIAVIKALVDALDPLQEKGLL